MAEFGLKLICGTDELDLNDGTLYLVKVTGGFKDAGQLVTIKVQMKDTANRRRHVARLIERLHWYDQQAIMNYEAMTGSPVYIGVKLSDGSLYDTTLGRGWLYKQLAGRQDPKERAIAYTLPDSYQQDSLTASWVDSLIITLRAREKTSAEGSVEYVWETLYPRWVGLARGCVMTEIDGGIKVLPAGTNLIPNSDFENEADRDNGWSNSTASLTDSEITNPDYVWNGHASMKLVEDGTGDRTATVSVATGVTTKHSLSCYVRTESGAAPTSADMVLWYDAALTTTFTADTDHPPWYRATAENFSAIAAATLTGVQVKQGKTMYVDSFQLELGAYCTPYIYGNLGRGYSFSSTAHTTSSVRAVGAVNWRNVDGVSPMIISRDKGTLGIWAQAPRISTGFAADAVLWACGSLVCHWDQANTQFEFTDGTTVQVVDTTFAAGDEMFVLCRWGPSGLALYVYTAAGVLKGSDIDSTFAAPAAGATFWLGTSVSVTLPWDGWIYEVQVWHEELTAAQITARATYGRNRGELPFWHTVSGTGIIDNIYYPTGALYNCGDLDNFPGDVPAGLRLLLLNNSAVTPLQVVGGLMRRAVPSRSWPKTRNMLGNQFIPFLEAEAGSASYHASTATATVADSSGGASNNAATVTPTDADNHTVVAIPICSEPEDLWKHVGMWRMYLRYITASADHFQLYLTVTTGKCTGPATPVGYMAADTVYRPYEDEHNILAIPSYYVDPVEAARIRQGDWAVGADGQYCTVDVNVEADAASGTFSIDGLLLIPHDMEFWLTVPATDSWPQNRVVMLDTCGPEPQAACVYDIDLQRFRDLCDAYGHLFASVHEPAKFILMTRRSGTGYVWDKDDQTSVQVQYRPRYTQVR